MRAIAFARPVIVAGSGGFAQIFSPETAGYIYREGSHGRGRSPSDPDELALLSALVAMAPAARAELGAFGRDHVVRHHGLDVVSDGLADLLRDVVRTPKPARALQVVDMVRSGLIYLRKRAFLIPSRDPFPAARANPGATGRVDARPQVQGPVTAAGRARS